MARGTTVYVSFVLCLGVVVLAPEIPKFGIQHPVQFIVYCLLAALASCLKVKLPGIEGNISVLFVLLLIGIVELSLPETMLIAAGSVLIQSFFGAKRRPRTIQVAFNIASLLVAVRVSTAVYNTPRLHDPHTPVWLRLAVVAVVFFVANTLPVAIVIALTEGKSLRKTWQGCYFWSFPYYLAGAAIAGLVSLTNQFAGWPTVVFFLPLLYAMYRSYRLYLDRLEAGRSHAEEMRAAAARLTAVLESTSDCVFAVDRESRIIYLNERARSRLAGGKQLESMNLWDAFPEALGEFHQHYERAANERVPESCEAFFPTLKAWFDVHIYPSLDGLAIYLHEVTEQRALQEQLRQSQKMEAVGRLAGGVAHDFNNLLTVILGYGAELANALPPDDTLQSSVTEIQKAGERAASLTKQLLAFSRQQVLQWQILQLNTIIQGMERMLRRLIGEDIRLSVVLDSALGKIKADRGQMEQIIMNLAVNSRDAMPEGGCLTITTTNFHQNTQSGSLKPNRYALLTVTDSGQGMDADTKARVFDPFFTTKELGKGTGLGLSTVYGIVEQIGGQISLQSQPGQGATFTIHLPCAADVEESAAALPAETGKQVGGRTILLVEDEDSVRKLTVTILSKAGYEILATSDGREFLGISTERLEQVDLLITDIVMPEISGPDLAARLKACRPGLRVLYISGYSNHLLLARGVQIETNLLQKPYTPDQLLRTVEAVLAA